MGDKKIKVLSGGEKVRCMISRMMIQNPNCIVLDEPTNHLDLHSVELLIEALNKYEGTLILVSHDRYFISKAANKIWEIVDGEIKEFKGTYEEWVEWKERMAKRDTKENQIIQKNIPKEPKKPVNENIVSSPNYSTKDKESQKQYQQLKKSFEKIESEINLANEKKVLLENKLSDPDIYRDKNKFSEVEKEHIAALKNAENLQRQYEEIFEKLMEMESNKKVI